MAFNDSHYNNYQTNEGINTHRAHRNDIRTANRNFNPSNQDDNHLLQTSTNIFIFSNGDIVGMIQSFNVSENRTINKLQAIGYEGVVQAVPSNTQGGQLSVTRIALYQSTLWNSLGLTTNGQSYNPIGSKVHTGQEDNSWDTYSHTKATDGSTAKAIDSKQVFKTLKDQRVPLEIQVKTAKSGSGTDYYVDTYIDCWLSSYSKSYTVGTITVAEQATIQYADVY
ncbi:MAG: hypothetical protein ACOCRK_00775 [bacterium]